MTLARKTRKEKLFRREPDRLPSAAGRPEVGHGGGSGAECQRRACLFLAQALQRTEGAQIRLSPKLQAGKRPTEEAADGTESRDGGHRGCEQKNG